MELRYQALYQMNRVEGRRKLLSLYEQLGSVSAARAAASVTPTGCSRCQSSATSDYGKWKSWASLSGIPRSGSVIVELRGDMYLHSTSPWKGVPKHGEVPGKHLVKSFTQPIWG